MGTHVASEMSSGDDGSAGPQVGRESVTFGDQDSFNVQMMREKWAQTSNEVPATPSEHFHAPTLQRRMDRPNQHGVRERIQRNIDERNLNKPVWHRWTHVPSRVDERLHAIRNLSLKPFNTPYEGSTYLEYKPRDHFDGSAGFQGQLNRYWRLPDTLSLKEQAARDKWEMFRPQADIPPPEERSGAKPPMKIYYHYERGHEMRMKAYRDMSTGRTPYVDGGMLSWNPRPTPLQVPGKPVWMRHIHMPDREHNIGDRAKTTSICTDERHVAADGPDYPSIREFYAGMAPLAPSDQGPTIRDRLGMSQRSATKVGGSKVRSRSASGRGRRREHDGKVRPGRDGGSRSREPTPEAGGLSRPHTRDGLRRAWGIDAKHNSDDVSEAHQRMEQQSKTREEQLDMSAQPTRVWSPPSLALPKGSRTAGIDRASGRLRPTTPSSLGMPSARQPAPLQSGKRSARWPSSTARSTRGKAQGKLNLEVQIIEAIESARSTSITPKVTSRSRSHRTPRDSFRKLSNTGVRGTPRGVRTPRASTRPSTAAASRPGMVRPGTARPSTARTRANFLSPELVRKNASLMQTLRRGNRALAGSKSKSLRVVGKRSGIRSPSRPTSRSGAKLRPKSASFGVRPVRRPTSKSGVRDRSGNAARTRTPRR